MGFKRPRKISDYASEGCNVLIMCNHCPHKGVLDAHHLSKLNFVQNKNDDIEVVGWRCRCTVCGGKGARITGTMQPPTGPLPGPQTERDWKALIRRSRG